MKLLDAIVGWSLENRVVVLAVTLIFTLVGGRLAMSLPIDATPDVTNIQVQIITSAPALSPVEVEQYVTVPVERSMSGIPHATQIRSISKYGLSVVTVVFEEGTDIYFARQLVAERMRQAESAIGARYGTPEMAPISSGLGEIFQFAVTSDRHTLMELQELMQWEIAPRLRMVPGIVEVNTFGGSKKQYQVVLDPGRLQALGVSVNEVVTALDRANANAGGGYIEHNREQLVVGSLGLIKDLDDLRAVVVTTSHEGTPVTIGALGEVQTAGGLRRGSASMNGKGEVVVGVAMMLIGENARTVTADLKDKLAKLEPTLPEGVTVVPFYDRSELVNRTIETVGRNLLEGALLVIAVLLVLLGNLRAGLIVASTIPLSMIFALVVMKIRGSSGNLMSLGALDFGLIVDAAVIIVENAVRRLGEERDKLGRDLTDPERRHVVRAAAVEVRSASVFGYLIIAIVYLPVLALRGVEGKMFQPMAETVLFALVGAFILSLTLVPVLASLFVRPHSHEEEPWLMRLMHRAYQPTLAKAMQFRALVLGLAVLVLLGTGLLFTRLGAEFVPKLNEGSVLIEARRLPGAGLSESIATDARAQKALLQVPEVASAVSKTGSPEVATDPMGIEQTDLYIALKPEKDWRKGVTTDQLAVQVGEAVAKAVPEMGSAVSQPIEMRTNELIAGVRSDVAAQIYGPDLDVLRNLSEHVASTLEGVKGAVDVRASQVAGLPYLRIRPDRTQLARYGLAIEDVNLVTETLAVGHGAGEVFEGERRFDLVVKVPGLYDGTPESLGQLPLKGAQGQAVRLSNVADISVESGPALVERDQQSRRISVEFNVRGRDMVSVVADAQAALAREVPLPQGYRVEWGGQFENYASARTRLMFVVPLALALIFFMLYLAFGKVGPAGLIFLNVPLAIVGGVLALWLRSIPFSISAGVGFIALFGVAVLNGLVLMSFTLQLESEGMEPAKAVKQAAELRLRPVLMTALVAALGFVPMALSTAPGSEVQRPLATVVIGGIVTATLLTLVVFPALYATVKGRRKAPAESSDVALPPPLEPSPHH